MVMYSWNPGRVEPSARSHSSPGLRTPADAVVPVTGPVVSKEVAAVMRRAALKKLADEAITEMSRCGPTPGSLAGSTKVRVRGSTVTSRETAAAPSANWYLRVMVIGAWAVL